MDPEFAHLRKARAERMAAAVLPAGAAVWTAAEVMHLTGQPGTLASVLAGAALTAVSWGVSVKHDGLGWLPWWAGAGAALLGSADKLGPLDWWPAPALTGTWLIATLIARHKAHGHDAVTAAREWRAARAGWLEKRYRWKLGGTHLLDYQETWSDDGEALVSEWYLISTKGTGKRASQFATRGQAEVIAEAEDLPPARVKVTCHRLAGRIEVLVHRGNPWVRPVPHPLAGGDPSALPVPCSVKDPFPVGAALSIRLWAENGGRNVNVVSITRWGKTVLLNCLSERITAASDAVQVRINLSIKGHAEAERWGPACHLTAFGPQQHARAVLVLRAVVKVIEWRSMRYTVTFYEPSREDPFVAVLVDESDSAAASGEVRKLLDVIATKGGEFGVVLGRAGQRGTVDYGSAKQRSQNSITVEGAVSRPGEARHATGRTGSPDMAAYAEGNPGVWTVTELGGAQQRGRAYLLERADSARIAAERAMAQPELHPECREFLGEPYEQLLSTEVFARWARAQQDEDEPPCEPGFVTVDARALRAEMAEDGAGHETAAAAGDPLQQMWDTDMSDDERARVAALNEKLAGVRQAIAETAAMPRPDASPQDREAAAEEAWRAVGEQAEIPEDARPVLLRLLRDGTTAPAAARELGVSKWTARTYLERLRNEGAAYVDGERKAARWRLAAPPNKMTLSDGPGD